MALPDIGEGTTLEIGDGASNAYAAVSNLVEITPPAEETEMVESKRLDLTSRRKKYITGLTEQGTWSFKVEKTAAGLTRFKALRGVNKNFKITVDSVARVVPSVVTKVMEDAITAPEIQTVTVELRMDGAES